MNHWRQTLHLGDVWREESLTFAERRDIIVSRVRGLNPLDSALKEIADGLADSDDVDEFDGWWSAFYDWADRERVWVSVWPSARGGA